MHTPPLFADLLIILLVSVPVAFLCLRLKLPLLVGFMLTGILIGPYGLGLIEELEAIELLAEIGVILLLFTIGIEFSIGRLARIRNLVLIGGGLQVVITITITAVIFYLFGRQLNQAIFFGFLVALSSTAIVLKSYAERNEIDAPHGRAGSWDSSVSGYKYCFDDAFCSDTWRKRSRFGRCYCQNSRNFFCWHWLSL